MKLYGYGEDSFTMYILKNKIDLLLNKLGSEHNNNDCIVLYRPSFGRKRGFGEFDFIIITPLVIYLGESKIKRSRSNIANFNLSKQQLNRHIVLQRLIKSWFEMPCKRRDLYNLRSSDIEFKLPKVGTLLYDNICSFLGMLSDVCNKCPKVANVLLIISYDDEVVDIRTNLKNSIKVPITIIPCHDLGKYVQLI